jgi:hypothetical protein
LAQTVKNAACYHLVTFKTPVGVQFFAAAVLWIFFGIIPLKQVRR